MDINDVALKVYAVMVQAYLQKPSNGNPAGGVPIETKLAQDAFRFAQGFMGAAQQK